VRLLKPVQTRAGFVSLTAPFTLFITAFYPHLEAVLRKVPQRSTFFIFRVTINLPVIYTEKDSVLPERLHPIEEMAGKIPVSGFCLKFQ
jgi:hypothetical protein